MKPSIEILWNIRIPMRDGVTLSARIYRPRHTDPLPVILTITPYGGDNYHNRAMYFAEHGYDFAIVDCRGRGDSDGDFIPEYVDFDDGYDTVEWLAAQPWCDGQVAMWGGSYSGENQWNALQRRPPHLKTIVPAAATHTPVEYPWRGPVRARYMLQWLIFVSGRNASPFNLFSESKIWIDAFTAHYLSGRPFHELETFLGKTSRHFQEYLQHPAHHPYWQQLRFSPADYRGFDIPILTLAGQYDDAQRGSLFYLAEHERHSGAKNHYAVIGAWDHGGTRSADQYVGGADFGAPATIDLNQLHLEWYDWVMKGGKHPAFLQNRIAYYVTGSNVWQYANSFTQLASEKLNLYLASNDQANDVTHSGILQPDLPDSRFAFADNFTFDPRDTRIAELEQTPFTNWLTDQRYDLNLFGNGLVYHTAPFETDVTLGGYVKLKLWIQMDVPDVDFQATLAEIAPDGSYLKLTEDLFRARYREGEDREVFSQPDEINCYELKAFTYFARQVKKGSRLRLVVKCPNSIYLQKNYHSGGNVDNESITDARAAHITLFHDEKHPSLLELPLI